MGDALGLPGGDGSELAGLSGRGVAIPMWTRLLVAMLLEARLVGENYPSF